MNKHLGGKKPHKTKSQRKIIVYREWADRFHLTTQSIILNVKKYKKTGHTYDPRDINSVFDFYDYLVKRRDEKINALRGIKKSGSRAKKKLGGISFVGSLFRGKAKAHEG